MGPALQNSWLVTGGTGLLGSNASEFLLRNKADVVLAGRKPIAGRKSIFADLANPHTIKGLLGDRNVSAVFHAAAIASIPLCAENPELTRKVNVESSGILAKEAGHLGIPFVYISTDAVYEGQSQVNRNEAVPLFPQTLYAKSKLAGEQIVLDANPNALVIRTNFFGISPSGKRSLSEFFINKLSEGVSVTGYQDVLVSSIYTWHLMSIIDKLVEQKLSGVFNIGSSQPMTKYDFGINLAKIFNLDQELISSGYREQAFLKSDHSDTVMDVTKIQNVLNLTMPTTVKGIEFLKKDLGSSLPVRIAKYATN